MAQKYPRLSNQKAKSDRNFLKRYAATIIATLSGVMAFAIAHKGTQSSKDNSASDSSIPSDSQSKHAYSVRTRLMEMTKEYEDTPWQEEVERIADEWGSADESEENNERV